MYKVAAALVVAVLLIGALLLLPSATPADLSAFPTLTDATLADRTIVDFGISENGIVAYSYLAEDVPALLDEAEVPELRTENSYTKLVAVSEGEDPTLTLESRFYSQPAYAQDADGSWRYLEYATTTEQAFRNRDMTLWKALTEMVVRTAYADTASPFSEAGDGEVSAFDIASNFGFSSCSLFDAWTPVRTAVTGSAEYTFASFDVLTYGDNTYDGELDQSLCSAQIDRGFLPFDTSTVSPSATISAVSLSVYVFSKQNGDNDGNDYITVSTSTQATHTSLTNNDYNDAGPLTMNTASEVIDSGERKDITSISTGAYLTFTFNANGIAATKKSGESSTCSATTGITCLTLREGHDAAGDILAVGFPGTVTSSVNLYASEQTGTSNDPYLSVTYTVPASGAVQSGMQIGSYGSLKVTGGGIKIK